MTNVAYKDVYKRFELFTLINRRNPDWNLISQILGGVTTPDTEINGVHYLIIGSPRVIYTAHYDTAGDSDVVLQSKEYMPHIVSNSNNGILGADDKSGLTVISFMIEHNVPGLYLFFGDEESGASQSRDWAKSDFYTRYNLPIGSIKAAIAFDRKGYSDVIQTQRRSRCCSMEYAQTLSTILSMGGFHYKPADGVYTDTANMIHKIPECTNLSIGYFDQHSVTETQDMLFLQKMVNFMLNNHKAIAEIPAFKDVEPVPVYTTPVYTKWDRATKQSAGWDMYDYEKKAWVWQNSDEAISKKKTNTLPTKIHYLIEVSDSHILAECLDISMDGLEKVSDDIIIETDVLNYLCINQNNYQDFELELLNTISDIPRMKIKDRIDIYSFMATLMSVVDAGETVYICNHPFIEDTYITYSESFYPHIFTNAVDDIQGIVDEDEDGFDINTTGVSESFNI